MNVGIKDGAVTSGVGERELAERAVHPGLVGGCGRRPRAKRRGRWKGSKMEPGQSTVTARDASRRGG